MTVSIVTGASRGIGAAVVMISSLAALTGLPHEAAYCASKRALEAAAETIAYEVDRFGVRVAVIEPGYTDAGLATSVWDPHMPEQTEYRALVEHFRNYWDADSVELEPRELVVGAVRDAIESDTPRFRYALGEMGPMIREGVRTQSEEQWAAFLKETMGMTWWSQGRDGGARP